MVARVTCLLFAIVSCATPAAKSPLDAATGAADARLADLLRRHWDWQMRTQPVWATQLGDHRFDADLGDQSQAAIARNEAEDKAFLDEARRLQPQAPADRVHLKLFVEMLENEIAT